MRLIAISGMMGSGKTTLAKHLSRLLTWSYAPESSRGTAFLRDLFANPQRWAFDAQLAFLSDKAISLQKMLDGGYSVVLDRTLEEDVEIFARHFLDRGFIDRRSFDTYTSIYKHFSEVLPRADVQVHCWSPLKTIRQRLALRNRDIDRLYPENHVESLFHRYEEWHRSRQQPSTLLMDTTKVDFRNRDAVLSLIDIVYRAAPDAARSQYSLFDDDGSVTSKSGPLPRGRGGRFLPRSPLSLLAGAVDRAPHVRPSFPYAYIAAPFTAAASTQEVAQDVKGSELFPTVRAHGEIGRGWYRRALLGIASTLESLGLHSLLPHRDVNAWGKRLLQSSEVFGLCTEHVKNCDLFVGLLGASPGSHYEFGLAMSLSKPAIVVHCDQLAPSYISQGIDASNVLVLRCGLVSQAQRLLSTDAVRSFIRNNVGGLE